MVDYIQPAYYILTPDLMSYIDPLVTDYLFILSKHPIKKIRPFKFRIIKLGLLAYLRLHIRLGGIRNESQRP